MLIVLEPLKQSFETVSLRSTFRGVVSDSVNCLSVEVNDAGSSWDIWMYWHLNKIIREMGLFQPVSMQDVLSYWSRTKYFLPHAIPCTFIGCVHLISIITRRLFSSRCPRLPPLRPAPFSSSQQPAHVLHHFGKRHMWKKESSICRNWDAIFQCLLFKWKCTTFPKLSTFWASRTPQNTWGGGEGFFSG